MRYADKGGECAVCLDVIEPGVPIVGRRVLGQPRWVHAVCGRNRAVVPDLGSGRPPLQSAPREAPATPPDDQRAALRWARAQLERMRRDGWSGDDAVELQRLRRAWPGREVAA